MVSDQMDERFGKVSDLNCPDGRDDCVLDTTEPIDTPDDVLRLQNKSWQQGAAAARTQLLEELKVYLGQEGWVYAEKDQDDLERIACDLDNARDQMNQAVDELSARLDRIRTGR